jgi:hypothetical protein
LIKLTNLTIFKNMRDSKKFILIVLFFYFFGLNSIFASTFNTSSFAFPENTEVRNNLYTNLTGSNQEALSTLPEWTVIEATGVRVNFFTEKVINEDGGNIYFCFSHGTDLDFSKGTIGSYIIKKSLDEFDNINYGITQIKIFYKNNDNSFIRLLSSESKQESVMEIQLYGRTTQKNIRVPLSLAELSRKSFSELANLTSNYVDWNFYITDYKKLYGDDVRLLAEAIDPLLFFLKDEDDGAIDREGNFVYIESLELQEDKGGLNCSGFAKWVVDGIYKPVTGENIDIAYLKEKHYELRGNRWSQKLEDEKDPYFGLDWTRNLAFEIMKLHEPQSILSSVDIRNLRYHEYRENIGFPIEDIKTVLYELAVTYPYNFYLGSLNNKSNEPPYLRQHTHVVVFFPYIDQKGKFQTLVYSLNEKLSVDYLKSNWKDNYIHLVQIEASARFEPSGVNFNPVIRR